MEKIVHGGDVHQLVLVHHQDQRVIGTALLFKYDAANNTLELGYVLARAYWGKGLAQEALIGLMDYCFKEMLVRRVEA